jgi:hypothetical protein
LAFAVACDSDGPAVPLNSETGQREEGPPSQTASAPWRLVITHADGRTEVVESVDEPIICSSQEEPRVLFFCGTSAVEGQPLPVAWDFLPVNLDAGDTYRLEGPATPQPEPEGPTPTVSG